MAESADFELNLKDKVSKPAKKAKVALTDVQKAWQRLERLQRTAEPRAAIRAFNRQERAAERLALGMNRVKASTTSLMPKFAALGAIGAAVSASIGVVGAKMASSFIRSATTVEDALARVQTVATPMNATMEAALEQTKQAASAWSRIHQGTAVEFIDANYNMASAGLDHIEALAGTRAAMSLATSALSDGITAGNLLAVTYNNLGNKTADVETEMNRLGDILGRTQQLFQIKNLDQLNESMKLGAPAAIQHGVSIEQLATTLGMLNSAGLQGSQAGTAFAATLRQMQKASAALGFEIEKTAKGGVDFEGTLSNIEKKFGGFAKMSDKTKAAFQQAFGDEGIRAVALLAGKTDKYSSSLDEVEESTGAVARGEAALEKTRSNQLKILRNQFEDNKRILGDALLPVLDKIMPHVTDLAEASAEWATANRGVITTKLTGFLDFIEDSGPTIVVSLEGIAASFEAIGKAASIISKTSGPLLKVMTLMSDDAEESSDKLGESGKRAATGFWDGFLGGLKEGASPASLLMRNSVLGVADSAMAALEMNSPSRVGVDIGENFAGSIGQGIEAMDKMVQGASQNVAMEAIVGFEANNDNGVRGVTADSTTARLAAFSPDDAGGSPVTNKIEITNRFEGGQLPDEKEIENFNRRMEESIRKALAS